MRAKEYYKLYGDRLIEEQRLLAQNGFHFGAESPGRQLMNSFLAEAKELALSRHCLRMEAIVALTKEMNQKWNALCDLFEKDGKECPLRRDGFLSILAAEAVEDQPVHSDCQTPA